MSSRGTIHSHRPKVLKVPQNEKFTSLQLVIYWDLAHFSSRGLFFERCYTSI